MRAFIRKNMGRKFVVALGGHEAALGEAEYIVRLPKEDTGANAASQRRAILERALRLNEQFSTTLREALQTSEVAPNNYSVADR